MLDSETLIMTQTFIVQGSLKTHYTPTHSHPLRISASCSVGCCFSCSAPHPCLRHQQGRGRGLAKSPPRAEVHLSWLHCVTGRKKKNSQFKINVTSIQDLKPTVLAELSLQLHCQVDNYITVHKDQTCQPLNRLERNISNM